MSVPEDKDIEITFEEAIERLEAIVRDLEDGPGDLQNALQRYEEGVILARRCLQRLSAAELRVQELSLAP